ncbi:TlpA family protein disulfide reductase [Aestuariirhabdus sp. LZHN29]|uniref:TlpA family protein disulfide reductase n=1 Tax=Aestuariirhabdus sp. LZHN29 TaxID=3417462 RepID=UPI003CF7FF4E
MRKRLPAEQARRVMAIFFGAVVGVVLLSYWHSQRMFEGYNAPLPMLELNRLDGSTLMVDELYGKPLIINIWATWCEPCREEMPALQRLKDKMGDRVQVIGISVDQDTNLIQEFNRRYGLDFAPYWDPDGRLAERLGVTLYPSTLMVSAEGVWLDLMVGDREWDSDEMVDYINELYDGTWQ